MTLRTAARWGVTGSAMPFALVAAWFLGSAVAGQPMAKTPFHGGALDLLLPLLAPAAELGFLVVLYLVSAGLAQPSRLSDAALAASVIAMVTLAVTLRWPVFPNLFSSLGPPGIGWLYGTHWRVTGVLAPAAWLGFLLTFVRWPAPPLARATSHAAGWLALAMCLAGLWPVVRLINGISLFYLELPYPRPWMELVSPFFDALRWVLLSVFALAVWRSRPAAEAPGGA